MSEEKSSAAGKYEEVKKKSWSSLFQNARKNTEEPGSMQPARHLDDSALEGKQSVVSDHVLNPQSNEMLTIQPRGLINSGNMCFMNAVIYS